MILQKLKQNLKQFESLIKLWWRSKCMNLLMLKEKGLHPYLFTKRRLSKIRKPYFSYINESKSFFCSNSLSQRERSMNSEDISRNPKSPKKRAMTITFLMSHNINIIMSIPSPMVRGSRIFLLIHRIAFPRLIFFSSASISFASRLVASSKVCIMFLFRVLLSPSMLVEIPESFAFKRLKISYIYLKVKRFLNLKNYHLRKFFKKRKILKNW